jgi:exodeoxyribonuclease VII large subunit
MTGKIKSVTEINREIRAALKHEPLLRNCWVTGEISNFKEHTPSGHWYFTLKDEYAAIKAVMFKTRAVASDLNRKTG